MVHHHGITHYRLLTNDIRKSLEVEIETYLQGGWELHGGPFATGSIYQVKPDGTRCGEIAQAVIKRG